LIGVSVRELCTIGDKILLEETGKQFKKEKDMKKGRKDSIKIIGICKKLTNCIVFFKKELHSQLVFL
jgi:hypothetical protein